MSLKEIYDPLDWHKWATVIFKPTFWWRLKFLFKPHDLIFCWGQDRWKSKGFEGQEYFAVGGVPTHMRHRFINRWIPPEHHGKCACPVCIEKADEN